ncbi:putative lipoprotein signal peptide (plasmid) [Paraburkholderia caribensis MBA4]|uniref:Putative lipoprotein signal peptide n=1 Tax=Paraburkholderia caribensis MBA4 TaxID=1323664 RepID=A0A0N7JW27_9BURK|nr:dienelactone hydrolase [Paraburkholderia caribensis]ALL70845.1 putative lipoprotein signal peptide [Paraburkholderia caribensis MBA4]
MKLFAVVVVVYALLATPSFAANVGFEEVKIDNGAEPPLTVGIWYPTDAAAVGQTIGSDTETVARDAPVAGRGLPLIVISHGGGGWYDSHYDTAVALAHAGFVAAAVSHAGDTFDDQSRVMQLWRRPVQLHRLVDYMLDEWADHQHLDKARIGAFGFSNGGFTVLVMIGGVPNLSDIAPYCQAHPDHDLCTALHDAGVDPGLAAAVPVDAWVPDPRIKAAVVAAPAFGFAFGRAGLSGVRVPVQLWRAANDRHQPDPYYEAEVRADLPRPPEYHVVPNAGHYDFLPPCNAHLARKMPALCDSLPGFDRAAFHEQFNGDVVDFFRTALR